MLTLQKKKLHLIEGVRTGLAKELVLGNSLVVQWLGLCISTAEGKGSILGKLRSCSMAGKKKKELVLEMAANPQTGKKTEIFISERK